MSDNVRYGLLLLCMLVIGYLGFNVVDSAMSESLDGKALGLLYASEDALRADPKAYQSFLESRLDPEFKRVGTLSYSMEKKPDQDIPIDADKSTAISMAIQELTSMQTKTYARSIAEIKMSDDKKFAYISYKETSTGNITFTLPSAQTNTMPYKSAANCIDTLTLVKGVTTWLQTNCQQKIALLQ